MKTQCIGLGNELGFLFKKKKAMAKRKRQWRQMCSDCGFSFTWEIKRSIPNHCAKCKSTNTETTTIN